jgi:hypothetical protein
MRKIPTLFKRDSKHRVIDEFNVDLPDEYLMTIKVDGMAVMLDGDGGWYARRTVKPGRKWPKGFIEEDRHEGKVIGWEPIGDDRSWRHVVSAIENTVIRFGFPLPGTFEAIGPHFQGNPQSAPEDMLIRHGTAIVPAQVHEFEELRELLGKVNAEGFVYWAGESEETFAPVAKIKRRDFGLPWPIIESADDPTRKLVLP